MTILTVNKKLTAPWNVFYNPICVKEKQAINRKFLQGCQTAFTLVKSQKWSQGVRGRDTGRDFYF